MFVTIFMKSLARQLACVREEIKNYIVCVLNKSQTMKNIYGFILFSTGHIFVSPKLLKF